MNTSECNTIVVTNCKNCPFCEYQRPSFSNKLVIYANCMAPTIIHDGKYRVDSFVKNYKSPKWCPLKKVSKLIIKHK